MTQPGPRPQPVMERFWSKVVKGDAPDDCWQWTGGKDGRGYGVFDVGSNLRGGWRHKKAHRWGYENLVGPIPDDLVLDHLCRNPSCVNPAHLEPVTQRVNLLRGQTVTARNAAATHCPSGHEYTETNTRLRGGSRDCRTCHNAREKERSRRKRAEARIRAEMEAVA